MFIRIAVSITAEKYNFFRMYRKQSFKYFFLYFVYVYFHDYFPVKFIDPAVKFLF